MYVCFIGPLYIVKLFIMMIGRLVQGVPTEQIIQDIPLSVDNGLSRVHLMTRKDLNNIRKSYGIKFGSTNGIQTESTDSVCVRSWVQDMQKLGVSNPVQLYMERGIQMEGFGNNDIMLLVIMNPVQRRMLQKFGHDRICSDSTHCRTGYNFKLCMSRTRPPDFSNSLVTFPIVISV